MLTLNPTLGSLPMRPALRRATALEHAAHAWGSAAWFSLGRDALGALASWLADRPDGTAWLPAYACDQVREPFVHAGCRVVEYDTSNRLTVDVLHLADVRRSMPGTHMLVFVDYFGFAQRFSPAERSQLRDSFALVVRDAAQSVPNVATEPVVGHDGGYAIFSLRKATGWPEGCVVMATAGAPSLQRPNVDGRDWLRARTFLAHELLTTRLRARANAASSTRRRQALKQRHAYGVWPHPVTPLLLQRVDLEAIRRQRRRNAAIILAATGGWPLERPLDEHDCPYYVPVLSAAPDELVQRLQAAGIEATRFWSVVARSMQGGWVNAAEIARRIVCLPTHHGLTELDAHRIAAEVARTPLLNADSTTTSPTPHPAHAR